MFRINQSQKVNWTKLYLLEVVQDAIFNYLIYIFTIIPAEKKKSVYIYGPLRHLLCAATGELSSEFSMALLECFGIAA